MSERRGLRDLQQMVGTLREVTGECPTHGAWSLRVPESLAEDASCPACAREAEEQAKTLAAREEAERQRQKRIAYLVEHCRIPERYRGRGFDCYRIVAGEVQAKVLERCRRYAQGFPEVRRRGASLVLCGEVGTGKTHLGCAIIDHVVRHHARQAQFWRVFEVIEGIRRAYSARDVSLAEAMREFVTPDLLVIDDIGVQRGTTDELVLLTELLSQRHDALRPTVLLSNEDHAGLEQYLGRRVLDRVIEDGGAVLALTWESYRRHVVRDEDLPRPAQIHAKQ